jgi:glucosamine-6-phosphate deaminase
MVKIKEFVKGQLLVKIFKNREEMGKNAAQDIAKKIAEIIGEKGKVNMVFAAAPSQNDFLSELVKCSNIDWNKITAFHMDEYIGLDYDAPQKFGNYLNKHIFNKVNFRKVYYIDEKGKSPKELIIRYSELLKRNPIDIICMGIGENGHIAFNDPHVANFSDCEIIKMVDLDQKCRMQQVHDKCFKSLEEVPTHALTMTIPNFCAANYLYCIVPTKNKSKAVERTINGKIDSSCPASILRCHQRAILYLDEEAAELL